MKQDQMYFRFFRDEDNISYIAKEWNSSAMAAAVPPVRISLSLRAQDCHNQNDQSVIK
jgi:hypothetical protein